MSIFDRTDRRGVSALAIGDLGGMMPPHISIRGNRFALVDAGGQRYAVPTLHLDVVILDANPHKSKLYYAERFDPNAEDFAPPTCFSDNGVAASANAQQQQARTCAECPHNEWGSSINELTGAKRKACSDRKKLAVLVLNDSAGLTYQLQVPPATLKALTNYAGQLAIMRTPGADKKADLNDVVTRVSFVDNKNGELQFEPHAWVSSVVRTTSGWRLATDAQGATLNAPDGGTAFTDACVELVNSGLTDEICGKNDRPWAGAGQIATPTQAPQLAPQPNPPLQQMAPQFSPAPSPRGAEPIGQPIAQTAPMNWGAQSAQSAPASVSALGHGGKRTGAGRPRKPPAAVEPQPAPQTGPMEVFPPNQQAANPPWPAQQPAQPMPLKMATPEQLMTPNSQSQEPKLGPVFAQPQDLRTELTRSLDLVRGLQTK